MLGRNWRCSQGELDLIVRCGGTVAFCEVKARSGARFGAPAEAVGTAKQVRVRRLAARWLREHRSRLGARPLLLRFDVAAILDGRITVLEDAF